MGLVAPLQFQDNKGDTMNKEALSGIAYKGGIIRDLMNHPGMELMRKEIDSLTLKMHGKWLLAETDDQAAKIRHEVQGYELFFTLAKQLMLQGDNAARLIKSEADNTPSA